MDVHPGLLSREIDRLAAINFPQDGLGEQPADSLHRSAFPKQVHQTVDLFIDGESPVVVAPDIFAVERQPEWPNPSLRGQAALQVPPEALQTVDVGAVPATEFAPVVLHQAVDVALGSDARVGGRLVMPPAYPSRWLECDFTLAL
jgi:hypothetical protein